MVVEAEPIDGGAVWSQPEQPRAGVAALRSKRNGSYFDEAKTQAHQRRYGHRVLIKTGGQANRIGKVEAQRVRGEHWIFGRRWTAKQARPEGPQC